MDSSNGVDAAVGSLARGVTCVPLCKSSTFHARSSDSSLKPEPTFISRGGILVVVVWVPMLFLTIGGGDGRCRMRNRIMNSSPTEKIGWRVPK